MAPTAENFIKRLKELGHKININRLHNRDFAGDSTGIVECSECCGEFTITGGLDKSQIWYDGCANIHHWYSEPWTGAIPAATASGRIWQRYNNWTCDEFVIREVIK